MRTNITIQGEGRKFNYIVEFQEVSIEATTEGLKYFTPEVPEECRDKKYIFYGDGIDPVWRNTNLWYNINDNRGNNISDIYKSTNYKRSNINIYFPEYSVDIYKPGILYAINFSTWVRGVEVSLGTYIISRKNALAVSGEKIFMNEKYYEYISLTIIDPKDLLFGSHWEDFRDIINNDFDGSAESILYISIQPVNIVNGDIIPLDKYNGGQNALNISHNKKDYLHLDLRHNLDKPLVEGEDPAFECKLVYDNDYVNLTNHLWNNYKWKAELKPGDKLPYNINNYKYEYEFIIGHKDDIFVKSNFGKAMVSYSNKFIETKKFTKTDIRNSIIKGNEDIFKYGIGYEEGMFAVASLTLFSYDEDSISNKEDEDIHKIYLLSNKIPITKELFKYFVGDGGEYDTLRNHINLTNINMNLYNINTVNKINQEVVYVDNLDQAKSNIISPTFFRSVDSHDITIYKQVTENICINLDSYKTKVDSFVLKIGDSLIKEYARTYKGVIFRIEGNSIINNTGTYYILDQNYNMVTHGKYNCIIQ